MSAAKHTPGPWWATDYGVRNSGGFICATTWPSHFPEQDERYAQETAQREADVNLIIAASDLLSIAQRWAALDGGAWHVARYEREREQLLADTRAAIAKATGGASHG